MTRLEFLKQQRAWCNKWMSTDADKLPGTLTHEKVAKVAIDTEVELVDYMVFDGRGLVLQEPYTED